MFNMHHILSISWMTAFEIVINSGMFLVIISNIFSVFHFSFSSGILITSFTTPHSSITSFFIFDFFDFHFGKPFEVSEHPHVFFILSSLLTRHISLLFQLFDSQHYPLALFVKIFIVPAYMVTLYRLTQQRP